MRAAVFTEGSTTTGESTESYAKYFGGSFRSVNTIVDSLSTYCDTEIHILSEDHGYVRGKDQVELAVTSNTKDETEHFVDSLISTLEDLDVVVLLFTTDVFNNVIAANWDQIIDNSKDDSIWCISTSRSALNSIELEALERNHPLLLYQRRGVARLGNETREELLEHIRARADD